MTLKYAPPRDAQWMMNNNLLVKHYAGSQAYGTSLPTSDVDFRGIFYADPVHVRTPFFPVKEVSDLEEEDTKFYELAHFLKLCLDCNPNIVETLWVEEEDVVFSTPAYEHLRQVRASLLSSKIAFTTSGYAMSQLKRIKGHNRWINNPQSEEPPRQLDYVSLIQNFHPDKRFKLDLRDFHEGWRLIPYGGNILGLYPAKGYESFTAKDGTLNLLYEGDHHEESTPVAILKYNLDEYKRDKERWRNYWTWKKNRNQKRSALEEEFGYDTKHAMHLVRLLRMGKEALKDGKLLVKRPDAEELLAIRRGVWTYEELLEYAEMMDAEIREIWYKKTELPKKPDVKNAASLLLELQDMLWSQPLQP
jgi:predicted nucleotidyltransferase